MSDTSTNNLPDGWIARDLESLVTLSSDCGIPRDDPSLPFVGMEHVERDSGDLLSYGDSAAYSSSAYRVKPGQVLYGRLRPYLNKAFMPSASCYASREFIPMIHGVHILPKFLLYRIRASDFVQFAISLNAGDRPRVKWPQMNQFKVLVPPLIEQEKIVEILEEQLSRLDAALAGVRTIREKAAQFRRSLLHSAFTGVLTGNESSASELPRGWQARPLGDVADVAWGDLQTTKASYTDEGFVAYSATGADGLLPKFDHDEDGIVLSAIGAACGKTWFATGKWSCIKNTMRILKRSDAVLLHFLALQLSDPNIWPKRGTGQPFIGQKDAREMLISVPTLAEQGKIIEILEGQLSRLDASLAIAVAVEKRAAALRRSLLHAAFTGKLTERWKEGGHV